MADYGTIKLPRDEYEEHNERRKDMGLTWSEYINNEAPVGSDLETDLTPVLNRLDDLENTLPRKVKEELR
jgi:hypothetical protein